MTEVLHLSARDHQGGAARATYRLHRGLRELGVDSQMLVQKKVTEDPKIHGCEGSLGVAYDIIRRKLDRLPVLGYRDRDADLFSPAWLPERRKKSINQHNPELIHLHWISGGFLQPKTIAAFETPILWTLHDMWPFTGGCHYAKSCEKYTDRCGDCPHLDSTSEEDLSRSVWSRKHKSWKDMTVTVVAPSRWLANCAEKSSLFTNMPIEVIPNGLDVGSFTPQSSTNIRSRFGLNKESKIICFGADWSTERKGTDLLYDALSRIETPVDSVHLVVFGHADSNSASNIDIPTTYTGFVDENTLRDIYATADLMIVPSRQEAFGQTASEALASGTPVAAFDATGLQDIVLHKETGYLAKPFDPADLANGIDWILADRDRRDTLSENAREDAIDRFSVQNIAAQYRELYNQIKQV